MLLAALYFAVNSLVTVSTSSRTRPRAARPARPAPPRPLRVSADAAVGAQTTTSLYLTLPRPASWCLMVLFAGMAFVLSQSFFVAPHRRRCRRLVAGTRSRSRSHPTGSSPGSQTPVPGSRRSWHSAAEASASSCSWASLVLLAVAVVGLGMRRGPSAGVAVNGDLVGKSHGAASWVVQRRHQRAVSPAGEGEGGAVEEAGDVGPLLLGKGWAWR
ncbi:hypothetical protein VTK56DRAFT_7806 [Thermocarpiscus australiensis]